MSRNPSLSIPPDAPKSIPVGFHGAGRVGTALACALVREGYRLQGVSSRNRARAEEAVRKAGGGRVYDSARELATDCRLLFITTSDDALGQVVSELLPAIRDRDDLCLVHCSGAFPSLVMLPDDSEESVAYRVAGFHPMLSFPTAEAGLARFPGTYVGVEGPPDVVAWLRTVTRDLQGIPVEVAPEGKVFYHAAACMASNFFVTLMQLSLETMRLAGVRDEEGLAALTNLVKGTLANVEALGPQEALTGPISRGDVSTVARHLDALEGAGAEAAHLAEFYRRQGTLTAELARRRGLAEERVRAMLRLFRQEKDDDQ